MINLRYHIVSLVAVFLALGMGIVMGSTVIDRVTVDALNNNLERRAQRRQPHPGGERPAGRAGPGGPGLRRPGPRPRRCAASSAACPCWSSPSPASTASRSTTLRQSLVSAGAIACRARSGSPPRCASTTTATTRALAAALDLGRAPTDHDGRCRPPPAAGTTSVDAAGRRGAPAGPGRLIAEPGPLARHGGGRVPRLRAAARRRPARHVDVGVTAPAGLGVIPRGRHPVRGRVRGRAPRWATTWSPSPWPRPWPPAAGGRWRPRRARTPTAGGACSWGCCGATPPPTAGVDRRQPRVAHGPGGGRAGPRGAGRVAGGPLRRGPGRPAAPARPACVTRRVARSWSPRRPAALGLAGPTAQVTAGNVVSRVTGLLRVLAIGGALGTTFLGNVYQTANLVSNLLFELLAAGMLSSVLVPPFVALLDAGRRDEAERLAGALLGVALVVLGVVTVGRAAGPAVDHAGPHRRRARRRGPRGRDPAGLVPARVLPPPGAALRGGGGGHRPAALGPPLRGRRPRPGRQQRGGHRHHGRSSGRSPTAAGGGRRPAARPRPPAAAGRRDHRRGGGHDRGAGAWPPAGPGCGCGPAGTPTTPGCGPSAGPGCGARPRLAMSPGAAGHHPGAGQPGGGRGGRLPDRLHHVPAPLRPAGPPGAHHRSTPAWRPRPSGGRWDGLRRRPRPGRPHASSSWTAAGRRPAGRCWPCPACASSGSAPSTPPAPRWWPACWPPTPSGSAGYAGIHLLTRASYAAGDMRTPAVVGARGGRRRVGPHGRPGSRRPPATTGWSCSAWPTRWPWWSGAVVLLALVRRRVGEPVPVAAATARAVWPAAVAAGGGGGRGGRRRPGWWRATAGSAAALTVVVAGGAGVAAYLVVQRLLRAPELDRARPAPGRPGDGRPVTERRAGDGEPVGPAAGRRRGGGQGPGRHGGGHRRRPAPAAGRRRGAGGRRRVDRRHRRRPPGPRAPGCCACPRTWARAGRWPRAWPPRSETDVYLLVDADVGATAGARRRPARAGAGRRGRHGHRRAARRRRQGRVRPGPAPGRRRHPRGPAGSPPRRRCPGQRAVRGELLRGARPGAPLRPGGRASPSTPSGPGPGCSRCRSTWTTATPAAGWPASPTGAGRAPTSSGPCGPASPRPGPGWRSWPPPWSSPWLAMAWSGSRWEADSVAATAGRVQGAAGRASPA